MCGCWYLQPGPELTAGLGTEGGRHTDGRRVGHLDGDGEARGRVKSTLLALVVVRRERSGGVVDVEDGCRSRGRWSVCWELTMVGVAGNDGRRSLKWGAFRGESIPCQCPCHVTSSPNVAGASSAVNAAAVLAAGQLGSGKGGSGDSSSVACCCTSPVAQACMGMGRGEQASDPTFLIKHSCSYKNLSL